MSSASIRFLSHLELFFNTNSVSIEHFNHLNILTNAYLSPEQPPAPETIQALESLHSNRSKYLETVTRTIAYLQDDLSLFIERIVERRDEEVGLETQYFNRFLNIMISAKNREKVRQLLIYPLILTIAFSYPPPVIRLDKAPEAPVPKEGKDSEAKKGGTGKHSTNPIGPSNVSTGTVSKKYEESNYEILPYSLNASASEEEREQRDLDIFKNLLNRYVIMVDDIVSYLPEADDNSISDTRKEAALCKNVYSKIVEPVLTELLDPCFFTPGSQR